MKKLVQSIEHSPSMALQRLRTPPLNLQNSTHMQTGQKQFKAMFRRLEEIQDGLDVMIHLGQGGLQKTEDNCSRDNCISELQRVRM